MTINIQQLLSSNDENEQCIMLAKILNGLFAGEIPVKELFSSAYQQCSDGNALDLAGFINHLAHLRSHVNKVEFEVINACVCEGRLAEHHIATVIHLDGQVSKLDVYVFMRFEGQKITSLEEITRVISGAEKDRELASVTS